MSDFLVEYLYVYLWLIVTTLINVVAPMAGSTIVNPVTAYFTDPQRAIGIGALIFTCTGIHRLYLFRKESFSDSKNLKTIQRMLPYSIIGAILGGSVIVYLSTQLLAGIIVLTSLYFIGKTIHQLSTTSVIKKDGSHLGAASVSLFSGLLQGAGMPGGDIRSNYLRTFLSEISVRAVTTVIGTVNFFITGSIIFAHSHLTTKDLIFIGTVVPLLILVQVYGKSLLEKMSDRSAKIIAITFSLLGVLLLSYKYLL